LNSKKIIKKFFCEKNYKKKYYNKLSRDFCREENHPEKIIRERKNRRISDFLVVSCAV